MQSDMSLDISIDHRRATSPNSVWKRTTRFHCLKSISLNQILSQAKEEQKQRLGIQLTSKSFLPEAGHDRETELRALSLTVWETALCSAKPTAANCRENRTKLSQALSLLLECYRSETWATNIWGKWMLLGQKGTGQCCTEKKDLPKQFLAVSFKLCHSNLHEGTAVPPLELFVL